VAGKDLTYTIGVDAGDAVSGLRKLEGAVRTTMKTVEDELDDGATAGDKLSESIDKVASQMKEDFAMAAITAERMGQALKDAGSDLNVADVIPQLQRMGLSMEEITQEADKLAVSLKGLDDARVGGVAELDSVAPGLATKLGDVGDAADNSRGVLANLVGNSAQDLGELSGVAGSAGVALGQLAEYAADGNISLKGLAGFAGPMAGLAVGVQLISSYMHSIAATKAFEKKRVQGFVDALEDGAVAAEELMDILNEDETSGIFTRIGNETKNVDRSVRQVLGTFRDFQRVVEGGASAYNKWTAQQLTAARAAGATSSELEDLSSALAHAAESTTLTSAAAFSLNAGYGATLDTAYALGSAIRQQGEATEEAGFAAQFYGEETEKASTASSDLADHLADVERAAADVESQFDDMRDSLDMERDVARFRSSFETALAKTQTGATLTSDEILGLKEDILTVAETAKLNPAEVKSFLDRIDAGDIAGVLWDAQVALNNAPVNAPIDAYVRYVPGAGAIADLVGVAKVPIDGYIRSVPVVGDIIAALGRTSGTRP
jgi:hypothetical protein